MKIFYGVQGTGNGHITRARAIAPKLKAAGADVTYLFTGRPAQGFCEMEAFGDYQWRAGLTFVTRKGNIQYVKTALRNNPAVFLRDIWTLDLSGYDVVISDFEPVTSWAARLRGIPTIGIGHQYAFGLDIPMAGADFMGVRILKYFAPVSIGIGVHWHHFNSPILPPIIQTETPVRPARMEKIIVYLPFEEIKDVVELLRPYSNHEFHVYHPDWNDDTVQVAEHILIKGIARQAFQDDFADCGGVLCNAGFELPSEAIHLGKKLLVKPLHGQMEQLSNALALDTLKLGRVMHDLDGSVVADWLESGTAHEIRYPDTAQAFADWVIQGDWRVDQDWIRSIWSRCQSLK